MKVFQAPNSEICTPRAGDAGYDLRFNPDLFNKESIVEVSSPFAEVCLNGDKLQFSTLSEPSYFRLKINTGVAVELPVGTFGKVYDRSSMALKGFSVAGGVIDYGYRGFIHVVFNLYMSADNFIEIANGDKIAQMIIMPYHTEEVFLVDTIEELSSTERGSNGFGSTGR